jgi:hypothetical protein
LFVLGSNGTTDHILNADFAFNATVRQHPLPSLMPQLGVWGPLAQQRVEDWEVDLPPSVLSLAF